MKQAEVLELEPGERIVFLGDSITQAGVRPGGYVALFSQAVDRALGLGSVQIRGAGISGNRVPDCQNRLEHDVLNHGPTVVVVIVGVNDVWHSTRGQGTSVSEYRDGLTDIVQRCQSQQARVLLCTPAVIGEKVDGTNSLDALLEQYCQLTRDVAAETNATLLDLRRLFVEHLRKINPSNKPHSLLTTDGVHLNALGNRFLADCLERAFGIAAPATDDRVLRHIVLFKFKPETTEQEIGEIDRAFRALGDSIPEVLTLEAGTNNSPEGLSKGFTHAYVVTFRGENERAIYLPHPEHEQFVSRLKPLLEDALVVDFWADTTRQGR